MEGYRVGVDVNFTDVVYACVNLMVLELSLCKYIRDGRDLNGCRGCNPRNCDGCEDEPSSVLRSDAAAIFQ